MGLPQTEGAIADQGPIDRLGGIEALTRMIDVQAASIDVLRRALGELEAAADLVAAALRGSGRLVYVAAGSSGLMALADGAELPGTFGIAQSRIAIRMAGGVPADGAMPGDTEDLADLADINLSLGPQDVVIALSASGTTPWAVSAAEAARANGNPVVGIANNPDTPLLRAATVAICLRTPPEALAGSTRMGAGTAQKAALNLISTLACLRLGHVYCGMMVNLRADNAKLKRRAVRIVSAVAGVGQDASEAALKASAGDTKAACLIAAGADVSRAGALIARYDGHLGPALAELQ